MNNLVDSSAWLEYFVDGSNAKYFAKAVEDEKSLIVPAIVIYEVFKKILLEKDENTALKIVAHMKLGKVIELEMDLAMLAARLSVENKLAMADSVILATARRHNAIIWTMDNDFEKIPEAKYFKKQ
ncbi:type II toxin-antitoxin system VapC family toxin [Candidatus Peregrinibacteria bacterium]|nr:type II toxin-antitoxin system VapC family toxin [Candidatus Peregrinibacteria bacterium]